MAFRILVVSLVVLVIDSRAQIIIEDAYPETNQNIEVEGLNMEGLG